jgi:hypothetical protein
MIYYLTERKQNCTLLAKKIQIRKEIMYINVLYIHNCVKVSVSSMCVFSKNCANLPCVISTFMNRA